MKIFTDQRCRYFGKWCISYTKSVRLLIVFFLVSSLFISQNGFSQAGTANVVAPTGGMKLDGHLKRQSAVGDWLKNTGLDQVGSYLFNDNGSIAAPYNGAEYNGLIFHKVDLYNNADDEGFDGGNKLFHNPNSWGWSSKKQLNKDDMNNSLVFITRDENDHIWVLISGDRSSENGTSYLDFEFYKKEITMTGNGPGGTPVVGGKGGFLSLGEQGGRTIGDLSVTLSFTAGGTVAGVSFLQWAPANCDGCYDYVPLEPDPGEAWVAANTIIVDVPFGAFGINTYAPNLFIEAAIDVTALLGSGTGDQCAGLNFKSLFIKTKSSAEKTADLKDFIAPFSISLCGDRTAPGITANGTSLTLGCNPSASDIEAALGSATATDNCASPTLTPTDGAIQSNGCGRSKTRTWSAVDACGNVTTTSRTATWVADQTAPVLTANGNNAALNCNPSASDIEAVLGSASASDGCGGSPSVSSSDGNVISNGCSRSKTRTFTAIDACNNTATVSRIANWTEAGPLTITCPPDRHYQCTDAVTSTTSAGVAVASGGCEPTVNFSDQETTRNCSKLIKRTWTATDACGQTATCVQNIVLADNTPPVITNCNGDVTDNCTSSGNILKYFSNGIWTAIDASGNIGTLDCNGARLAPTTNVVEETKPVVTEGEEQTLINKQAKQLPIAAKNLEVYAYPNPYTDQVNFRFVPTQSGMAKLELYDMFGRQMRVINIGNVQGGVEKSVSYKIPALTRITMFYKLTVGDQTGNGTLIAGTKEP